MSRILYSTTTVHCIHCNKDQPDAIGILFSLHQEAVANNSEADASLKVIQCHHCLLRFPVYRKTVETSDRLGHEVRYYVDYDDVDVYTNASANREELIQSYTKKLDRLDVLIKGCDERLAITKKKCETLFLSLSKRTGFNNEAKSIAEMSDRAREFATYADTYLYISQSRGEHVARAEKIKLDLDQLTKTKD